jgi:tripartite-type tricarboxylate transporter receptor subunit TctC
MSPAIIDAWNRELRAATESADLRGKLEGMGLDVLTSSPTEFQTRQTRLVGTFQDMIKNVGYTPE